MPRNTLYNLKAPIDMILRQIVARSQLIDSSATGDDRLDDLFRRVDRGIDYFNSHQDEAVQYISTALDYSEEDAKAWLKTVKFASKTKGVDITVVEKTVDILRKAGVLKKDSGMRPESMIRQ